MRIICLLSVFLPAILFANPYQDWQQSGVFHVITTPEGANLPADAVLKDFPLLLRLNSDYFDFKEAAAGGADLRFSDQDGKPLAYELEQWDPAAGQALVWIRVPLIKGNDRQPITMHWGKPDATSESNAKAVFDASNHYYSVWHMDKATDAIGKLVAKDGGTEPVAGMIGAARQFDLDKGLDCGRKIEDLPTKAESHTTELWMHAENANGNPFGWGNQKRQGKVVMIFASPPHIRMDCWFSDGSMTGTSELKTDEWIHVLFSYQKGKVRLYVNGELDAQTNGGTPLNIISPASVYIGGWWGRFNYVGAIDEFRLSTVARSAAWAKLQYENQRTMQRAVGHLVQAGSKLQTSTPSLQLDEGQTKTITATAGGAQKVYWSMIEGEQASVIAVDRFSIPVDAGRVSGDTKRILRFTAIYPNETKHLDVLVSITEKIPDPSFSLKAPATWNGRGPIEVIPEFTNLQEMTETGAAELTYTWTASGLAVGKREGSDHLILTRAQNSGELTVALTVNNGGNAITETTTITVREPAKDPFAKRQPAADEKPFDGQFYARGPTGVGMLHCNGKLTEPAKEVVLELFADDKSIAKVRQAPTAGAYAFSLPLKPGFIHYRMTLHTDDGELIHEAKDIVCGDAYIIEGQSNALATDTREKSPEETHEWIRSYANARYQEDGPAHSLWCKPVWKARSKQNKAELGWWGMELAKRLVKSQQVPICIINGAKGGTRIDQHQRNATNPEDLETIYGRLLWRVRQARLTHGIRAVIWHQGESDQGAAGPTGRYGWEDYQQYFVDMSAAWKEDFPNLQHYYLFQIWPNACAMGRGNGNMLREELRTLPDLYSNMDILSTLGIRPPGGCHYPLVGWAEFARLLQPLIERDFYGAKTVEILTSPNLVRARFSSAARDAITLEFDQPVVWTDGLEQDFFLDDQPDLVKSATVTGNTVTLKLAAATDTGLISYLDERRWDKDRLLMGANGHAALTFCNVPIEAP